MVQAFLREQSPFQQPILNDYNLLKEEIIRLVQAGKACDVAQERLAFRRLNSILTRS